jgi:hypothetical protein
VDCGWDAPLPDARFAAESAANLRRSYFFRIALLAEFLEEFFLAE